MNELELAQSIRDYIKDLYSADYIGYLVVEKIDSMYKMSIGIPSYMYPTIIAGDFNTDEEFLDYVFEDIRVRNYVRQIYYKVIRLDKEGLVPIPAVPPSYTPMI